MAINRPNKKRNVQNERYCNPLSKKGFEPMLSEFEKRPVAQVKID